MNKSNIIALSVGAVIFLILILVSYLLLGVITYNRLFWIVAGTLISWLLAILLTGVILPLDYNRTELVEFEDEEYKYYVTPYPKLLFPESLSELNGSIQEAHGTVPGKIMGR